MQGSLSPRLPVGLPCLSAPACLKFQLPESLYSLRNWIFVWSSSQRFSSTRFSSYLEGMKDHQTFALLPPSFPLNWGESSDLGTGKVVVPRGTGVGLAMRKPSKGSSSCTLWSQLWLLLKSLLSPPALGPPKVTFWGKWVVQQQHCKPKRLFEFIQRVTRGDGWLVQGAGSWLL